MKSRLVYLAGCALFAASSLSAAHAQSSGSPPGSSGFFPPGVPYVGAAGAVSFFNNLSPSRGGAEANSHLDVGYVGLGTVGYDFGNGFRAELEAGYRHSYIRGIDGYSGPHSGSVGMITTMVNGLYDFHLDRWGVHSWGLVPHVGIGIGWARPTIYHAASYNGNTVSGTDDLFAYQGIVGVGYPVTRNIRINLDYHYLGTTRGGYSSSPGLPGDTTAHTSFTDQAVLLGFSYSFNPPPPPPPPEQQAAAPSPPPPAPAPEAQRQYQVFFDFDKSDITDAASQILSKAADAAKSGSVVTIKVTGHTDTVGSKAYNQALSERRADAVKQALVAQGVSDTEITTVGVGKTDLLVPTDDGVREPQNRRATIEMGTSP